jgi:flavin-dependent dehydrogenase
MSAPSSDVVVIGGGPAGSTMASFLSMKGHDVTVFERDRFPREHVGESMLPFCYHVFDDLGILPEMENRFVRKPGVRFLDVDGATNTAWCFAHKIEGPSQLSFQVIRSEFDQVLLQHSASLGATVHEETRVRDVQFDGDQAVVTVTGPDGEQREHTCRFVVDASGRDTFMSNRLGTKTAHKELERTALSCSYWKGAEFKGTLEEGLIQIVYLGGEKQGWIWCIPLGTDRLSVGVVMNTAYYRARRRDLLDEGVEDWRMELYRRELQASPFTADILRDAHMERDLMVNGDYSYFCQQKWGDDFCLVGDASAFIDPIFSSGVYLAMNSSRIVSEAVHTRLLKGVDAGNEAFADVYTKVVNAYNVVDKLIRLFYTPEAINFAQLGSAEAAFSDFQHYQNAIAVYHFLIAGDFFEQANKYSEFIDTLRDPKTFRRYKKYVIERPGFSAPSCGVPSEVAFHAGMRSHEERRDRERI